MPYTKTAYPEYDTRLWHAGEAIKWVVVYHGKYDTNGPFDWDLSPSGLGWDNVWYRILIEEINGDLVNDIVRPDEQVTRLKQRLGYPWLNMDGTYDSPHTFEMPFSEVADHIARRIKEQAQAELV